jgi:hypothetical protein
MDLLEYNLVRLGYKIIPSKNAIIGRKDNMEIIISNDDNGYNMYFYIESEQRIHITTSTIEPLLEIFDSGSISIEDWLNN